jgi:hypothetical protein
VRERWRFAGDILGFGTAAGVRVVVGRWPESPYGPVADVMVERLDGSRLLLAPTEALATFVAATYGFDDVRIVPVAVEVHPYGRAVVAGPLRLRAGVGRRTPLGLLLQAVPAPLAAAPAWTRVTDPVARLALPGVRTRGTAGGGRVETYGALDERRVVAARASWDGEDLGALAPVDPPVRFGFGSTPRRPSLVRVVTTITATAAPGPPDG